MKKLILLLLVVLVIFGCAPTLKLEQYSLRMTLPVRADSSVYIGDVEKFVGVMGLKPILNSEGVKPQEVKLVVNYGVYYVIADNFKNVWMVTPKSDGVSGAYKSIDLTPQDKADKMKDTNIYRYGSKKAKDTCVVVEFSNKKVYINKKGGINEKECE
jgi:hypothetical protein